MEQVPLQQTPPVEQESRLAPQAATGGLVGATTGGLVGTTTGGSGR